MKQLTPQQRDIVCACILRPKIAIWADMGAGKTAITLHAIVELLRLGFVRRAVVVAPRAVADSTWRQEAAIWPATKSLRVITLRGDKAKRKEQAATPADVYCIGRDALAGTRATIHASTKKLPSSYKYHAESTQAEFMHDGKGWVLVSVWRGTLRQSSAAKEGVELELSDTAKEWLLDSLKFI